jgi:hypothetical protein
MPGALVGKDNERRRFFVVKRTERFEIAPRLFQCGVLSDNIHDVNLLFDVIYDWHLKSREHPKAATKSCGSILSQLD